MKNIFEFVSTNVLSGLENVVINICTLVKGYNFTYVSPSGPINKYLSKYHINHIIINKITPFTVRNVIKQYHPDIVHGHDVKASLSVAFNAHLCHLHNIEVISELHNDDPRMWKYNLRSLLYALSAPFYDKIIVISNAIINHYIFKDLVKNKIEVIPNIVNTHRIDRKYLITNMKKKWDCIFIGRLVNQKNPIKFVYIVYRLKKHYKHITSVMLGNGYLYKKIQNTIKKLGLVNNIQMLGFQNNPYFYLKKSKICVIPSKFEGFGLVALESLLMGTPVIASCTGGLINIVNNKCGGFARSITTFCDRISSLLNDKKAYEIKSHNAFKRANVINDEKSFINKYSTLYEKGQ